MREIGWGVVTILVAPGQTLRWLPRSGDGSFLRSEESGPTAQCDGDPNEGDRIQASKRKERQ